MSHASLDKWTADSTADDLSSNGSPLQHRSRSPQQSMMAIKKKSFNSLIRMGRTRSNRAMTLASVNKRYHNYSKQYQKLLSNLCTKLGIPPGLFQSLSMSDVSVAIQELLKSGNTSADAYLKLFPDDIQYSIGEHKPILELVLTISSKLEKCAQSQQTSAMDLMNLVQDVVKPLENIVDSTDFHLVIALSWWLPQFMEIIAILFLISEPSKSSGEQPLRDFNTLGLFLSTYQMNLVVVIYLISGAYLVDLGYTKRCSILKSKTLTFQQLNHNVWAGVAEKAKKMNNSVRKRLHSIVKEAQGHQNDTDFSDRNLDASDEMGKQINSWKDIYYSMPPICSTTLFLFLVHMPDEMRFCVDMDVTEVRSRSTMPLEDSPSLFNQILDRAETIGHSLDTIQSEWPYTFTPELRRKLLRSIIILIAQVECIHQINGAVPFAVPESWEIWGCYIEMLNAAMDYLTHAVHMGLRREQMQSLIGFLIVETRYVANVKKIETAEDTMFRF
mmetsp:Transcript_15693/g.61292  ORF Transcript_15693/g.61292 Transcript_15693/m.61292 type:complete len:500 (-) Transcript_15693:72-1571(-)|eukprot:CAMPEP_0114629922 /NCGR_PEP_ID=MMETSP0168-20121206/13614_1 /TAXON_ID=95228 ORGANISM="Vannella sp., Strain DIVA3 517/6/12" /NCGR_SAMPLE_ID=MMETSP0168 /ASSEMBLY_ACC=CAM_ASM_000044 /LENGTH=499 /DNA_ID=CAMNT_0001841407 /DNA_START=70 /DNA_END=1569 /DNA_ORIENTATION=-